MQLTGLRTEEELAAGARSAVYLRLARAFGFPTPDLVQEIASSEFLAGLLAEVALLPFAFEIEDGERLALADGDAAYEEAAQEYLRLFEVGAGRPPCPLYEGSHRSGKMNIMEEAVRFYEHFGLRTEPGDQPDHVCAELEFMHYLAFKEAAAITSGNGTGGLALAQRDFLARRLCRWLPRLRARAEQCGASPLYRSIATVSERFCSTDRAALKKRGAKPDAK